MITAEGAKVVAKDAERDELNRISGAVVDAAMKVHTALGPGLLESTYAVCLARELRDRGFTADTEIALPVVYRGVTIEHGYRIDLLVNGAVIVELKAAESFHPLYEAQLLSYLKLSGKKLGLLVNFNVAHLKDGIKRRVNGL